MHITQKPLSDLPEISALQVAKKEVEEERDTLKFTEDPVAYFSKRKDGSGHFFIYMIYEKDKKDPFFSPYDLVKVTSHEIGDEYFTMSASGVTHIMGDGDTETFSLDCWEREKFIYSSMRKLKFFSQYFIWKCMRNWRLFLKEQRFNKLREKALSQTVFANPAVFKEGLIINQSRTVIVELLRKYLLSFPIGRRFRLPVFEEQNHENIQKLKSEYLKYINKTMANIVELFQHIADPLSVQVTDQDFDFERTHPNIQKLEYLEEQKAILRYKKTEEVNRQIASLGNFVRMVDYLLLEALAKNCVDCWEMADHNVSQEGSSIFQVEVLFDDKGGVTFQPDLQQLETAIEKSLQDSIMTLNSLPRILKQQKLKVIIENSGVQITDLYKYGPIFEEFTKCENVLPKIQENILNTLRKSYNDAFTFAQTFSSFYPIYKMGQTWNPNAYLITRSGKQYEGEITENPMDDNYDAFLVNTKDQPIVDFEKAKKDIETFIQEEYDLGNLRQGIVKGVLQIDLKTFRQALAPIPVRSKLELTDLLQKLAKMKIAQLETALSKYGKVLKMEPQTLDSFVTFCEVFQRAQDNKPAIKDEIKFVDDTNSLFDAFPQMQIRFRNPLHIKYQNYENDLLVAASIKENSIDNFIGRLKEIIANLESQLNKYHEKASAIPPSLSLVDTEKEVPRARKRLKKVQNLEEEVIKVTNFQKIIGVELNKFAFYSNVINVADFALTLYSSVESWQKIFDQITHVPFAQLNINQFRDEVLDLGDKMREMQNLPSASNYPILNELAAKVNEITPYIDELQKLSKSRMQTRHWNTLFESCDQQVSYNPKMTTEDLLKLNILTNKEKIEQMTNMSQGEYELEAEFYSIANYWNKVQMPIAETGTSLNEENLLLGSTEGLLKEINDALITIGEMLQRPYVQGIRDTVTSLASTLENIEQIIEAWQLFQSNWVILSSIFSHDNTRSLLPQQANKFTGIQRKWSTIARHTIKDTRLFSVCGFPSLLDALHENNQAMESIIASLGKLLDSKRVAMPRLYFLSNDDVLQLISTSSVKDVNTTASKIFMYVKGFHIADENGNTNAPLGQSKLYKIIGENNSTIKLNKPIDLSLPAEIWLQQLVEEMHESMKTKLNKSLEYFEKATFKTFIEKTNPYLVFIIVNVILNKEFQRELRGVKVDKTALQIVQDMVRDVTEDLDKSPEMRSLLAHVIAHRDRLENLFEEVKERKGLDPQLEYINMVKTTFDNGSFYSQCGEFKSEIGYEFWGKLPNLIFTKEIEFAFQSIARNNREFHSSILVSSPMCGKRSTIKYFAANHSRFVYTWYPFPDNDEYFLSRVLIGSCVTGSWAIFLHLEKMKHRHMCYLFDNLNTLYQLLPLGTSRITISSKVVELNQGTRIFLTGSSNIMTSSKVPTMLRTFVRSIAIAEPDLVKILMIKMMSLNFKNYATLGPKLAHFTKNIIHVWTSDLADTATVNVSLLILNGAVELMKKVECDEELAIMSCIYDYYGSTKTPQEKGVILQFLMSEFAPEYDNLIDKFNELKVSEHKTMLIQLLKKEAQQMDKNLPIDYLAERAYDLILALQHNDCVVIVGNPNSGKTTILKMIKNLVSKPEFQKTHPDIKPTEIFDCYFDSDHPKRILGHIFDDLTFGQTWSYGQLQAILHQMSMKESCFSALRFDGEFSKDFATFLRFFLPGPDNKCFFTSSQNIVPTNNRMKIIFETTSVKNASPGFLSRVSLIYMASIQNPSSLSTVCALEQPSIPFGRAMTYLKLQYGEKFKVFERVFNAVLPPTVKRMYHSQNLIHYSQDYPKMKYGNVFIFDTLPYMACVVGLVLVEKCELNYYNEEHMSMALAIAIDRVFTPFFFDSEKHGFDEWIRNQLNIALPKDWVGFSVPDAFWDFYPKPTLASMRIDKQKLVPLDFKMLDQKPIFQTRSEGRLPLFPNEVYVMNVQFLSQMNIVETLLEGRHNVILHGPPECGKTSFLQILFNNNDTLLPIYMNASEFSSAENFISFFLVHTPFLSKILTATTQNKIIVLVVSGMNGKHTKLQEFLRSINETGKVNAFSTTDSKVYETLTLMKFVTVITTSDISHLSARFMEHYIPIGFDCYLPSTSQFIAQKVLMAYDYSEKTARFIVKLAVNLIGQFNIPNKPMQLLQHLFLLVHADDTSDNSKAIRMFLYEFQFRNLHKYPKNDVKDKLEFISKNDCKTEAEKNAALELVHTTKIILPLSNLSKDMKNFTIEYKMAEVQQMEDHILKDIAIFNANVIEKVTMRVAPAVARSYAMLIRALKAPGCNVILCGIPACGKYTMSRVIAHSCEYDFINIAQPTPEELLVREDRLYTLYGVLRDVITNAVLHQKKAVIFIRATEETIDETNLIVQFMKGLDFSQFFPKSSLEDLYSRFTNVHALSFEQRLVAMRQIKNIIRINVHAIISTTKEGFVQCDMTHFVEIKLDHHSEEAYTELASEAIEQSAAKKLVQPTNQHIARVLGQMGTLAMKYTSFIHPNMVYDFIDSFCHFATADYQNVVSKNENIQSALSFVAKLEIESRTIDRRLDSLAPTLQRLQVDSESLQSSYTTRKEAIDNRKTKLLDEKKTKSQEVEALRDEVDELKAQFKELTPKLEESLEAVKKLDQNDIDTIRISASDPMPSMRLLFEAFCVFLDLAPTYERSGQKLLMDPKFIDILTNGIMKNPIQQKTIDIAKSFLENDALSYSELEATAPGLLVLYEWIQIVCQHATARIRLGTQKRILEEKEKSFKQYVAEMDVELASIEQVAASLENELKNLQASKNSREQMEKDYKAVDERKKYIDSIFKDIEQFTEKWQNDAREFTTVKEKLIGNSMIFSFFLVFSGTIKAEERVTAYNALYELLKNSGIESSEGDLEAMIQWRFVTIRPDFYYDRVDTINDLKLATDIHHAFATLRTPLIIDCDGYSYPIIQKELKGRIIKVSACSSTLEFSAAQAVSEGKTLLVTDVTHMLSIFQVLIPLDSLQQDQNMSKEVRIGGKVVNWDPNFKLILLCPLNSVQKLPLELLARTTPIDLNSTMEQSIKHILTGTFAHYFYPEVFERVLSVRKNEIQKKVNDTKFERDILDILADVVATQNANANYDYLSDTETIQELIHSKEEYFKNKQFQIDFASKDEYKQVMRPFSSFIKSCTVFWQVFSRTIPDISDDTSFLTLTNYINVIESTFSNENCHPGPLLPEQQLNLREALTSSSLQLFLPLMKLENGAFMLFLVAFINKIKVTHLSMQDLKPICDHMRQSVFMKIDYEDQYSTYDIFERLKYTSFEHYFDILNQYVSEFYGSDFYQNFPQVVVDRVVTNNATIPSLIITRADNDPSNIVHQIVSTRSRIENVECISLRRDIDFLKNMKKVMSVATSRGNWLVLHITETAPAITSILSDIFSQMTTTSINTNFRMIVLSNDIRATTYTFNQRSKTTVLNSFISVKTIMQQIVNHYAATIVVGKHQKLLKKLVYAISSLIGFINYRNILTPNTYNLPVYIQIESVLSICARANEIMSDDEDNQPIENIRSLVMYTFFQNITDRRDRLMVEHLLKRIIRPETFQDDFKVGVGPEAEDGLWTMPDDSVPISSFTQYIQKVPAIPRVETLGVDPLNVTLRNWNLSRMAISPYLRYSGLPQFNLQGFVRKIEDLIAITPKQLPCNTYEYKSLFYTCATNEVQQFNDGCFVIMNDLMSILSDVKKGIFSESATMLRNNSIPHHWKQKTGFYTFSDPRNFLNHLLSVRKELNRLLSEFNYTINCNYVYDLKPYITSFVSEEARKLHLPMYKLKLTFEIIENDEYVKAESGELILKHLFMMFCVINSNKKLVRPDKEQKSPFLPISAIRVKVTSDESYPSRNMIPITIYAEARPDINELSCRDKTIHEGYINNFVCNAYFETEDNPSYFSVNGSSIYCRVIEQLV